MGGACSGSMGGRANGQSVKILLLGGANVGKSTIFKQMRILYKEGFEDKDREWARGCIVENILETLIDLDAATDDYGFEVLEENEDLVDEIKPVLLSVKVRDQSKPLRKIDVWNSVERLWSDPGIQAVFQEIQHPTRKPSASGTDKILPVLTGYFLQQLDRVKRADYVPSDEDILHLRRSTSDSDSITFKMDVVTLIGKQTTLNVHCTDVGGQAHERTEWSKHADNLNAILYVLSLPEYSNVNSAGQNQLQMQLDILSMVRETDCFKNATIIVLLNKVDLLEAKLQGLKVSEYFPDYDGSNELADVVNFFKSKVASILDAKQHGNKGAGEGPGASVAPAPTSAAAASAVAPESATVVDHTNIVTTCATDTRLMRTIIERIGLAILQKTLAESNFFI